MASSFLNVITSGIAAKREADQNKNRQRSFLNDTSDTSFQDFLSRLFPSAVQNGSFANDFLARSDDATSRDSTSQLQQLMSLFGQNQTLGSGQAAGTNVAQGLATNARRGQARVNLAGFQNQATQQAFQQFLQNALARNGLSVNFGQTDSTTNILNRAGPELERSLQAHMNASDPGGLGQTNPDGTRQETLGGLLGSAGGGQGVSGLAGMFSASRFKQDIEPVDTAEALAAVRAMPVSRWRYKGDDITHVGPMAEDFHEATGLGDTDTISIIDAIGTLTAAVQELAARTDA